MKVALHGEFDSQFPEKFAWEIIESIKLSEVAIRLACQTREDLRTEDRLFVPGLRVALNCIAREANV